MRFIMNARDVLKAKRPLSTWSGATERRTPTVSPIPSQRFRISTGAQVFTIGSCFARNIEEHLSLLGYEIPTLRFKVPKAEWKARANGILNKYTPAAIYQELQWTARALDAGGLDENFLDEMRQILPDGRVVDLQLGGYVPVSPERYVARRKEVFTLFSEVFNADCVIITLGLTEAWRDRRNGLFVQQPPASREMLRLADNFEFVVLDYRDCSDFIVHTLGLLQERNPNVRVLVTTSPVPMRRTFTHEDVLIANMTSKATLRAAAAEAAAEYEFVDYFPSYEAAVMTPAEEVFKEDMIHIRDSFVGKVTRKLANDYLDPNDEFKCICQSAAIEIGEGKPGDACAALVKRSQDLESLTSDQVVLVLRVSWRLRNRISVRRAAREVMARPDRCASHFSAVSHIFPRNGLMNEARRYAEELLNVDPSNPKAIGFCNSEGNASI